MFTKEGIKNSNSVGTFILELDFLFWNNSEHLELFTSPKYQFIFVVIQLFFSLQVELTLEKTPLHCNLFERVSF